MNILTLDDHPLFSCGLKTSLMACDPALNVVSQSTAVECLSYLQDHQDIDILILDMSMPDMDGVSFMKAMIARDIQVPVAILSALDDMLMIKSVMDLGALGYLPKTWPVDDIVTALYKMVTGAIVLPEYIRNGLFRMSKHCQANTQSPLSYRQLEILTLVQSGLSNQGIADVLFISEATVKSHLQTTFKILGAKNRVDGVRKAESLCLLSKRDQA